MYPYCAIFQAGEVAPSCSRRLQLLVEVGLFVGLLVGLQRPELSPVLLAANGGRLLYIEEPLLALDIPRPRGLSPVGVAGPVLCGLRTPRLLRPIEVGNALGFALWAALLNAPRHCST